VVASQHRRAAEVGAAVLEAGGDAIDAAVATSFALGVVEPWMSGVAAGGCMVLWRAKEQKAHVVDYGMRAPRALDPADYPLAGEGKAMDLFAWPLVKDDRNVQGAAAVAVPGVVAGMALAHERFGRVPWRELVAPAAALAAEGMRADWYSGLLIASAARGLAADPDAAAMFLEDGRWPILGTWTALTEKRLDQRRLAATLESIARDGPKALYGGDVGTAMAKDVRDKGGCLSLADFSAYRAHFAEPLEVAYRGGRVFADQRGPDGDRTAAEPAVSAQDGAAKLRGDRPVEAEPARRLERLIVGRAETRDNSSGSQRFPRRIRMSVRGRQPAGRVQGIAEGRRGNDKALRDRKTGLKKPRQSGSLPAGDRRVAGSPARKREGRRRHVKPFLAPLINGSLSVAYTSA